MKDVLILSIPLAGILVATYLMLQYFHNKSTYEKGKEIDIQKTKTFFPLQIQAYERVILFLERIDPNNMIIRTHKNGMNAITLHRELLKIVSKKQDLKGRPNALIPKIKGGGHGSFPHIKGKVQTRLLEMDIMVSIEIYQAVACMYSQKKLSLEEGAQ